MIICFQAFEDVGKRYGWENKGKELLWGEGIGYWMGFAFELVNRVADTGMFPLTVVSKTELIDLLGNFSEVAIICSSVCQPVLSAPAVTILAPFQPFPLHSPHREARIVW